MSGTSVDGLDLALCRFTKTGSGRTGCPDNERPGSLWAYEILKTNTLPYSGTPWPERFARAEKADGYRLMELHRNFGKFTGEAVKMFLGELQADLVASHGHTIFHRPEKGITLQIGDGAEIAATTGITAVSDFRRLDVALGGQGAPLVPAGDELLFGQHDFCLNMGGFANISYRENSQRMAFDICPANIILNRLARSMGHDYDKGGNIALSGKVIQELLSQLESLGYYQKTGPRSLGREWVNEVFMPVLERSAGSTVDKLRTVCEHIALRIAAVINKQQAQYKAPDSREGHFPQGPESYPNLYQPPSVLSTGGGTNNEFLIQLIAEKVMPAKVIIPEPELIDFKEAVVFAFLGVLRLRNEINCLASVTGAAKDNSGGVIYPQP